MFVTKVTRKEVYLTIAILAAGLLFTLSPYRVRVAVQTAQANAVAATEISIVGQYLKINNKSLDIQAKPALFIDSSCRQLISDIMLIPAERRPYLIVNADTQPDFVPSELAYYWSPNTGTRSPSLVWYDQKLTGCMYSAVEAELYKLRFPMLIGKGQVLNSVSDGGGKNAARAAEQINGTVLMPGEVFSFYQHVVPSAENGFVEGLTLYNTEAGPQWMPDIGGGICRTATALNFAVQNARLSAVERHHHSKPVAYAELGQDTAVARSAGWDYQFRNTCDNPIQIFASQNQNHLVFEIYQILDADQQNQPINKLR